LEKKNIKEIHKLNEFLERKMEDKYMDVEQRLKIIMTPAITSLIDSRCSNNCNEVLRETTQRLEDWHPKNKSHRDEFNNIASLLNPNLMRNLKVAWK